MRSKEDRGGTALEKVVICASRITGACVTTMPARLILTKRQSICWYKKKLWVSECIFSKKRNRPTIQSKARLREKQEHNTDLL